MFCATFAFRLIIMTFYAITHDLYQVRWFTSPYVLPSLRLLYSPSHSSHKDRMRLGLKGAPRFAFGFNCMVGVLYETLTPGYAMMMNPNKAETAFQDCQSTGNWLCACVQVLVKPRRCVVTIAFRWFVSFETIVHPQRRYFRQGYKWDLVYRNLPLKSSFGYPICLLTKKLYRL